MMANIRIKEQQKTAIGSPRGEVGEIDTRAPFQSVKAAVSLFGEVAVSSKDKRTIRRSKLSSENVLDKETQLLLAQKELNNMKQQLESTETTKSRAFSELEKAKRTQDELNSKLTSVNQSKQSAMEAAELIKNQAKKLEAEKYQKAIGNAGSWKKELNHLRAEYITTIAELDASKQELTKIRQDFDAALEAKLSAFQLAAEAQRSANLNNERSVEISKEIEAMRQSIEHLKVASDQAQQEEIRILAEKEELLEDYKIAKEVAEKNLMILRKEIDHDLTRALEEKLKETTKEIEVLQEEMRLTHASEMDTVRSITAELNEATKSLQQISEEEISLRNLVSSLRLELENVKRERDEEEKISEETKEQNLKLHQLLSETETARKEMEEMKKETAELNRDAESNRLIIEEAERKLEIVQKEVEEAKEAGKRALDEMKIMGEEHKIDSATGSESSSTMQIKLTVDEFESLSKRVRESEMMVEKEEMTRMAEMEVINERKNEAAKKLDANLKAIEEIKIATEMALKGAEMAESAKMVVEGELRRWRQEEQKVGSQASSGHIYF